MVNSYQAFSKITTVEKIEVQLSKHHVMSQLNLANSAPFFTLGNASLGAISENVS